MNVDYEDGKTIINFLLPVDENNCNIENLKSTINKANKKAKKFGAEEIVFEYGEPELREFIVPSWLATYDIKKVKTEFGVKKIGKTKILVRDVKVCYTPIRIKGGWMVLASIEKLDDSEWNIINGKIDGIEDYKKWDLIFCDHCGTHRKRKKVIVLEDKNGNRKVVGRQCVKDYLGISVNNAIFAADFDNYIYNILNTYEPSHSEEEFYEGGKRKVDLGYSVDYVVRVVAGIMYQDKWNYRSKKYDGPNTVDDVVIALNDLDKGTTLVIGNNGKSNEVPFTLEQIVSENSDKAAETILKELRNEYPSDRINEIDNSFDYDLAVMLHVGRVKKLSYFIGMLGYRLYKRYAEQEVKRDPKNSEYVGNVGDKIKNVDVEIKMTRECDGYYGSSLMISGYFKGTDNIFVTFNSGNIDWLYNDDASVKKEVTISATIKAHQDKGYGKQTVLTRFRLAK